jgi:hypothetical protein
MSKFPNFGPYAQWENVAAFSELSEKAFTLFDGLVNDNWSLLSRPVHHLFLRIAYQAKTTSLAIRVNNSWALSLPAFALTRVRLEQTIICSYLIHEEEPIGLSPFVEYIPIGNYKATKTVLEDASLAEHLSHVDLSVMETVATESQKKFTPSFSLMNDKFERSWTKLDLRSMAKRRDLLVNRSSSVLKQSLEREYITIYKEASSIVHADCSSLSFAFLDLFKSPSGQPVLMAVPSWALIVSATTSHYDILQCYEVLSWIGIEAGQEYQDLMGQWTKARDKHVST